MEVDAPPPPTPQLLQPILPAPPIAIAPLAPNVEQPAKKKKEKREAPKVERPPGKTLLPISKVQHIIKADKDIAIVAKEATFLICCATEEFIKRFGEAGMAQAEKDKRTTLQYKDMATVVRKADEFLFLEEIIPWTFPEAATKRPVKSTNTIGGTGAPTLLDQFMVKPNVGEEQRIITNEDGTMHVADTNVAEEDLS
ncbi:hypothetical protein FB45DRAFT_897544 [Roridomyces roridus]|uniref:Transcription factor CBF/NF-Y/archaeal histone domain-containing protein n=1 Tax=Roridomyces roridus TaxID=1738132 RepID=A0AAD7FUX5_9AGAR|nr:hypothetical protein FB45DRAFT_897544 [Roridomyces roridus]